MVARAGLLVSLVVALIGGFLVADCYDTQGLLGIGERGLDRFALVLTLAITAPVAIVGALLSLAGLGGQGRKEAAAGLTFSLGFLALSGGLYLVG